MCQPLSIIAGRAPAEPASGIRNRERTRMHPSLSLATKVLYNHPVLSECSRNHHECPGVRNKSLTVLIIY